MEDGILGDFDGDGYLDVISNKQLYMNLFNENGDSSPVNVNYANGEILPFPVRINTGNKYLQQDAFIFAENKGISLGRETLSFMNVYNSKKDKKNYRAKEIWEIWDIKSNQTIHNKQIKPSSPAMQTTAHTYQPSKKRYLTGDFDGNGISELILLGKSETITFKTTFSPCIPNWVNNQCANPDKETSISTISSKYAYRVDFDESNVGYWGEDMGRFFILKSLNYDLKQYIIDFDGDGRDDILQINGENFQFYSYDINKKDFVLKFTIHIPNFNNEKDKQIVFGDINGDGKTDMLIPEKTDSYNWTLYTSYNNSFLSKQMTLTKYKPHSKGKTYIYHKLQRLMDIDGDGKDDFITIEFGKFSAGWGDRDTVHEIDIRKNTNVSGNTQFVQYGGTQSFRSESPTLILPLVGNFRGTNFGKAQIIMYRNAGRDQFFTYSFQKDHSIEKLSSVRESGGNISKNIYYDELLNKGNYNLSNNIYESSNNNEPFPYIEHIEAPNFFVVKQLANFTSNQETRYKHFKYYGLVSNVYGEGIKGFKKFAQSNWVNSNNSNEFIWSVEETAPKILNSTITSNYTFAGLNFNLIKHPINSELIAKNTLYYGVKYLDNTKAIFIKKKEDNDFINSTTTTIDLEYNDNLGLIKSIINNGISVTEINNEYIHNPTGINENYYINRLKSQTTKIKAYGDSKHTQIVYTYTNNLISKKQNSVLNINLIVTNSITEDYNYDKFGNVIQKTISAPKVSNRIIKSLYDITGRFVIEQTDGDGLETKFEYDNKGMVTLQIDPFNVETINEYDGWGKLLKTEVFAKPNNNSVVEYTPIITKYKYERFSYGKYSGGWKVITSDNITGENVFQANYNVFGYNFQNTTKGFKPDTFVDIRKEYDGIGREIAASDPVIWPGGNPLFTRTEYDYLSRPIRQILPTSKIITTTYNKLSTTISEGTKTKTIIRNYNGDITSVNDNGEIITYTYYADGSQKTANYKAHITTSKYDAWGNRIYFLDPSVSSKAFTNTYNNHGEVLTEVTPTGTTTYTYTPTGKVLTKKMVGDNTDITNTYTYNVKGLLTKEIGTSQGKSYSYSYTYNNKYRLITKTETTPYLTNIYNITYDVYGRISQEKVNTTSKVITNAATALTTSNVYNTYNGILDEVKNAANNATIWKISEMNERDQITNLNFGNGIQETNEYHKYGFITGIEHKKGTIIPLALTYNFDIQKDNLNSRTNAFYGWNESFTYDNFDRLITWKDNLATNSNSYHLDGRINVNNKVGIFGYAS